MNAPVDIIISIIERAKREAQEARAEQSQYGAGANTSYIDGRIDQCEDLIDQLEGFKKLFS